MGHDHHHHHHTTENIKTAFWLNAAFTIIEIFGGVYTNSLAVLSDAMHDFGDTVSLGLAWYFHKLSQRTEDKRYTYGYGRFSVVGALINIIILTTGSALMIREAIPRLLNPQTVHTNGMLVLAILGIVVNGLAVLRMRDGKTANEKVIMLHLMEDALGWAAVLIGTLVMKVVDLPIIDPILSVSISAYILWNALKNGRNIFRILLQRLPDDLDVEKIRLDLQAQTKIVTLERFQAWTLDGAHHVVSLRIIFPKNTHEKIQEETKNHIRSYFYDKHIQHISIESCCEKNS